VSETLSTECQKPSYASLTWPDKAFSKSTESDAITSTSLLSFHSRSPTGRVNESDLRGCRRIITGMEHADRLINVQELADYLGLPVTTLYQWRYRREGPPGFRVGRHLRYRWSDVQRWIEDRLETGSPEPVSQAPSRVARRGID
jgi:excisionase family DNA binding protein